MIAGVSLLYATAGQAGGTAFLAVMAFAAFPAAEMRPTALSLNVVAAGYATWRVRRTAAIDRKMLFQLTVPSLVAAFVGGLLVIGGRAYFILTGLLLIIAAGVMILRRATDDAKGRQVHYLPVSIVGTGAGLFSGLTGVGGGVFLTPILIGFGWASPRRAAILARPFIFCNSAFGLAGVLLAGQMPAPSTLLYALSALVGAVIGTAIGLRWMSAHATRYVLAAILLLAGFRLLFR
jgi:hypothetical protein